ncbi:hypothetical protein QJS10_CPB12g01634 [Acorus calamus]|uniref:Uncharacterized protein n=1 Tax=Acorus calamus TaxID=4465 RepID=A0AAV9DN89_ACOCL|nr:hypothetical protein QJS10_CPB12g01634 [Acorus calamus]
MVLLITPTYRLKWGWRERRTRWCAEGGGDGWWRASTMGGGGGGDVRRQRQIEEVTSNPNPSSIE